MPAERIFFGYDAVDNTHFAEGADSARRDVDSFRRKLDLPARYILGSGRFVPKKNFPGLVAAYGRFARGRPDLPDLVILGDGPERPSIEASAAAAGVRDRVRLPGFQNYNLLPAVYGLAETFIHVSLVEQWGLVINEAAAAGLPLIVSRACGAASELVVDGENGYLVRPHDIDGIAATLTSLFNRPAALRTAMGAASRRVVASWGIDRFAESFSAAVSLAAQDTGRRPTSAAIDWALAQALSRWPQHSVS
jgi:glycosyltransferase involved in cell wall biosynthesis